MHVEDVSILGDDCMCLRVISSPGDDHVRVQIVFEMRIAGPQLRGDTQAQPNGGEQQQTDSF